MLYVLMVLTAMAQQWQGDYEATDLGCATPTSSEYVLEIDQTITRVTTNSYHREVQVLSAGAGRAGFRFRCLVDYEGTVNINGTSVTGELSRVGCDCGQLDQRTSERLCQRGDIYVVEKPSTPIAVRFVGNELQFQQLGRPDRAIPGCGNVFPEFVFERR